MAGALSAGGLPERLTSWPVGPDDGGFCGAAGAAPVVTPGPVLAWGVTSRMPGGGACGDGWFCAVLCGGAVFCAVDDVPAWLIDELFRP